jgi:ligand-binding sensor domain-containing protein/signal transduction histidine kinase
MSPPDLHLLELRFERWLKSLGVGWRCLSLILFPVSLGAVSTEIVVEDQEQLVEGFQLETWTVDDGLPQNSILSIAQGDDGYLWIGTVFGLARFDGAEFEVFDRNRIDAIRDDVVTSIHVGREGTVYWGTQGGLVCASDQNIKTFGVNEGLPSDHVLALTPASDGGLWVLTHPDGGHVSLLRDGMIQNFPVSFSGGEAVALAEDRVGGLWLAESRGLSRFDLKEAHQEVFPLSPESPSAFSVLVDESGGLWAGSEGGMYRRDSNGWGFVPLEGALAGDRVYHLALDRDGGIWASGGKGVAKYSQGEWSNYPLPSRFTQNRCSRVFQDANSDYWFGSRDNGLHRIRQSSVEVLSSRDGMMNESIWSICEGEDQALWFGTGGGLTRWSGESLEHFGFHEGIPRPWVTTVCQRSNGELWFGMRTGGQALAEDAPFLGKIVKGEVYLISDAVFSEVSRVWVVFEDRNKTVWIGTMQGLFRYQDGQFYRCKLGTEGVHRDVRAIAEDSDGGLWFGTNGGGLCYLKEGREQIINQERGLSHDNAWAIHLDGDGVVWVGTEFGLNRIENGSVFQFGQEQGLFDDLVNQIVEDDFDNLWLSCNRGVYRVRKQELAQVQRGELDRVEYVVYGTADGMLSAETNGECQPAGCRTSDGRIVFPTSRGVVVFDAAELLSESHAPPVVIELLQANNETVFSNGLGWGGDSSNEELVLQPGSGDFVEIKYTANSFISPARVSFEYRLFGHHDDWVDAGPRRIAHYVNLAPGSYRFEVRAANYQGVWNQEGAALVFLIHPHFYQRPLFYVSISLLTGLLAWGAHRWSVRHRVRLAHLEDRVKLIDERSRIARDMHDEIGATLTQITLLSEVANRELGGGGSVRNTLAKIRQRSRGLVESVDEIVWATNPRNDSIEGFIAYFAQYATEFLKPTGITFRVMVPPPSEVTGSRFDSEVRHHLFLAAKEALNNAVKHANASSIEVACQLLEASDLVVSVRDNGVGMGSSSTAQELGGDGLKNMELRMRSVGGVFQVQSVPTGGTRVVLTVSYL